MHQPLFIADRTAVTHACELIASFGADAGLEAAARAERSRDLGNAIQFCHWRQIERVIQMLAHEEAIGTIH